MNELHWLLVVLFALFVVLRLGLPRHSRLPFDYLRYTVLTLVALVVLAPFAWLVCGAIKTPGAFMEHTFLPKPSEWPTALSTQNFVRLFEPRPTPTGTVYFWRHILNSIFYASTAVVLQVFFCSLGGYTLAKYAFAGKRLVVLFMLGSMMIPPMLLLSPLYAIMVSIGWIDSYLALIVPSMVNAFGMFLFRQAIIQVPNDLLEAGRVDGCSEFGIYYRLVMPLVRPMTAAFCLIVFLATWNNFIGPQIYLHSEGKLPLPVILSQYTAVYEREYGVFLAGTLIAITPPAILFLVFQREFVRGLTSGAVKG